MITTTTFAADSKPKFGAMKGGTTTMSNYERIDLVKDTLQCDWIRTRIVVFDAPPQVEGGAGWTGFSNVYEYARDIKKLKQVVVIVAYPTGTTQPFVSAAALPRYKAIVTDIVTKYPEIECIVVDNEAENDNYHSITSVNSILDYLAMMGAVVEVCKPRGIKVADSGLLDNFAMHMKTYKYVEAQYGLAEAASYALVSKLTPQMIDYINDPVANPNPVWDVGVSNHNSILAYGGLDYTNMHFYEDPLTEQAVDLTKNMFRYQNEYCRATGGRRTMSNEVGQRNNEQPELVTKMMTNFYESGLEYCIWWDGDGSSAAGARSLTTPLGVRKPNGDAFVAKVLSYK